MMENFLIEHISTLKDILIGVIGLTFLVIAGLHCSMENWFLGVAMGLCGLLVLAVPVGMRVDEAQRLRAADRRLQQQETACSHAPTTLDGERYHLYAGTVVDAPSSLGVAGAVRPDGHAVFLRVDGPTTDLEQRHVELIVQGHGARVSPGSRMAFCGHAIEPVHWWPQIGYQTGEGAVYGEPEGPYPAVRWAMDMDDSAN